MHDLRKYKGLYREDDIWIVGAGPSMNHVEPSFFDLKIVFSINWMFKKIGSNYNVVTDSYPIAESLEGDNVIIASKYHGANESAGLNIFESDNLIIFDHLERGKGIDDIGKSDNIVVGYGTVVTSLHIAAYMGAKNIILCGFDCGWIDGIGYLEEYREGCEKDVPENLANAFDRFNDGAVIVKRKLKEIYGCNIHSLNPFVNFRMEGHKYAASKH